MPSSTVATACDAAFPERRGWFTEYYDESRHWAEVPASFRSWPDYEDKAAVLRDWTPSIVTGLLQAEDYARALITVQPSVTDDVVAARLTARMERQRRVLTRDDQPTACFIVDELSLYREVGSTEIMAGQMRYRVSESLRMIERLGERWATGVNPLTATATAGTA